MTLSQQKRLKKTCFYFAEDETMAKELEEVYGDIDAVEYFIGIMLEKRRAPLMFGQSLTEIGSPYSLKGRLHSLF